ncbi:hypothetical protein [Bradyrhizobium sp. SSUT77]|uniref:hypothetical protein n=1 Tax=Bradyrhizobium sp. SSUT77 TaxID=3040603 RepID=UPI00244CEB97|nr:hypothetical protein [Bradyrhizobium sp. SSUT77]MDH2343236.1 hypothetical protein [Bradyrhizobium sp. SSUT77]
MTLDNFGLVLIASIAALIAYLQWVTAHQKVVVDLFDRRRKAFELVEAAIRPVFREGEVADDAFRMLFEAKAECRFLFGDDVNNYLDSLHADYAWLIAFTNSVIDQSQNRSQLIDEKYERLNRIIAFYKNGAPLFLEYLRLDMKVRYFWPFPPKKTIRDPQDVGAAEKGIRAKLRHLRRKMLKAKK